MGMIRNLAQNVFLVVLCVSAAAAEPGPFAACEARLLSGQGDAAADCFLDVAQREGLRPEAARHLEKLLDRPSGRPWLRYYLGLLSSGAKAADALRRARDDFQAEGERTGAFKAQLAVVKKLDRAGLLGEAEAELELARSLQPADDPYAAERIRLIEAMLAASRGELDEALVKMTAVKDKVIPGAPGELREELLYRLGVVYYELGRYREAEEVLERCLDINRALRNGYREAAALYMIASCRVVARSGESGREQAVDLFRAALAAAQKFGNSSTVAGAHLELGKLLPDRTEARRHLDRCLGYENELDPLLLSGCLGALAYELRRENPERARQEMDRAVATAGKAEEPWPAVYLWTDRLPVAWAVSARPRAVEESLEMLRVIEEVREAQLDDARSVEYFSVWAGAYSWLAGQLLETSEEPVRREDLELAFAVTERYRARVLLERLQEARAWPELPPIRRDEVRALPEVDLGEVEESLHEDEALLVFQLGYWQDIYGRFAGGSWLFAVTRKGTEVYRLGDPAAIEERVEGLLDPQGGRAEELAAQLYRDLLETALEGLPAGVDRLLIVPDSFLFRLPFGALGPAGGEPLAVRYQMSRLPSASIRLQWRRGDQPRPGPALVLADPVRPMAAADDAADGERGETRLSARLCRRLPYAREEGEAILRQTGRASELRLGEEASEGFVKRTDLRRFGVIHVASHAFVDETSGERSLICLAAGDEGEDGDLEVREIVHLALDGQLVVLASCDSARGPRLAGEGVMSLARAFFLAGARTVVASLRDIDDAEAKNLFVRFHGHLARGLTVAAALHAAKREIFAAEGADAASADSAWASVVVIGDGSLRPFGGGRSGFPIRRALLLGAAAIVVLYFISIGIRVWLQRR